MRYACASLWSVCGWCVGLGRGGGAERTAPGNDSISYYSKLAVAGAVNSLEEATTLIRTPAGFDHDGYKILCKPLLSGNYEITELDPANDQRAS